MSLQFLLQTHRNRISRDAVRYLASWQKDTKVLECASPQTTQNGQRLHGGTAWMKLIPSLCLLAPSLLSLFSCGLEVPEGSGGGHEAPVLNAPQASSSHLFIRESKWVGANVQRYTTGISCLLENTLHSLWRPLVLQLRLLVKPTGWGKSLPQNRPFPKVGQEVKGRDPAIFRYCLLVNNWRCAIFHLLQIWKGQSDFF